MRRLSLKKDREKITDCQCAPVQDSRPRIVDCHHPRLKSGEYPTFEGPPSLLGHWLGGIGPPYTPTLVYPTLLHRLPLPFLQLWTLLAILYYGSESGLGSEQKELGRRQEVGPRCLLTSQQHRQALPPGATTVCLFLNHNLWLL